MKTVWTILAVLLILSVPVLLRADGAATGVTFPQFSTSGVKTADALIKTGPGFLRCVILSQHDPAPTAGTVSINDAVSAGTGTVIFEHVFTTAVFMPVQVCPETAFTTGLYIDITTSADISVVVTYK